MRWSSLLKKSLLLLSSFLVVLIYPQRDLVSAAFQTNPHQDLAESAIKGELLWAQNCVGCHGPQGMGDGAASALLPKRPKDLTMIAPAPVFPDGVLAFRISHGKNAMPAWQDALSQDQIWDLVSFIRSKSRR